MNNFNGTTVKSSEFFLIYEATLISLKVEYFTLSKKLQINCGKMFYEATGNLESNKGLLPFQFVDEEHNLKYSLDVDLGNKVFVLDVQGLLFETLPFRFYPFKLKK